MSDLFVWITGLFDDCLARAPTHVAWELDRPQPPLIASVRPADMPMATVHLDRDDIRSRIDFACRLQALLQVALDHPVPACLTHKLGLTPARSGDEMIWACPEQDFWCNVGDYELAAFWPPTQADMWAAPLLARRFERRGITGVSSFSVDDHDGHPVVRLAARPDADEAALRAAAAPLHVEFSHAPAISTVRRWQPADERGPARETLSVIGVAIRAARLDGTLRRASPVDGCDFLVGDSRVRLAAAHLLGAPGSPLLQDSSGVPFADEGELVSCGGGGEPHGPVRGSSGIFSAGQISVRRDRPAAEMADASARAAETYDGMAEAYDLAVARGERPYNSLYERPAIISMLPDVVGKRVLDVGCGSGPLSAWMSGRGAAEVIGFDASASMVRLAQQKQIQGASFRVADLSMPLDFLADESFDLAVASLVMHYLHEWVEPLRELRRVLRPDGQLIFSTHHPASDVELSRSGNYFHTELLHEQWNLGGQAVHVHFWRRPLNDMFAAFQQAGFTVRTFLEPQPLPECREKFPQAWRSLTTRPAFAFFELTPTRSARHQP